MIETKPRRALTVRTVPDVSPQWIALWALLLGEGGKEHQEINSLSRCELLIPACTGASQTNGMKANEGMNRDECRRSQTTTQV